MYREKLQSIGRLSLILYTDIILEALNITVSGRNFSKACTTCSVRKTSNYFWTMYNFLPVKEVVNRFYFRTFQNVSLEEKFF
jgi:hypothetical protein